MYTYPEALNGLQKLAADYFKRALPNDNVYVNVIADSRTGTASVDWHRPHGATPLNVAINMPVRPAQYRMSAGEFDHWAAYLLHEIGHPLHTDKAVWDTAVRRNQHRMLNAVDDVRQEKLTIDMKLAFNAKAAFSALVDSLLAKAWAEGYDPNNIRSFGWTIAVLGRAQNGYAVDAQSIWARLDPKGGVKLCLDWALPRLAACVTTQDCLDLANEISAFLAKFKKPKVKLPDLPERWREPTEGPSEPAERDEDEEASEGADSDDDAPEAPQGGQSAPREPEDEAKAGGKGGSQGAKGDENAEHDPLSDADFDDAGLQPNEIDNMQAGSRARVQEQVIAVMRQGMISRSKPREIQGRSVGNVDGRGTSSVEYVPQMAARMGRQRALLARALKREEEDTFEGGRTNGRFDSRRISKALQGDPHVFGKRMLSEGYDTDVEILVDGSGSMSGSSIVASSVLSLVVAQAARQVGVDCFTHVFNDRGLHEATKGKAKPDARKFAYMINQIMGGTPLCENMVRAGLAQVKRATGKRKVMFLVTDGGCNMGQAIMKEIGLYLENSLGIEIANLHIGHAPMGVFRNECAVNVNEVGKVGLERLTKVLEQGR